MKRMNTSLASILTSCRSHPCPRLLQPRSFSSCTPVSHRCPVPVTLPSRQLVRPAAFHQPFPTRPLATTANASRQRPTSPSSVSFISTSPADTHTLASALSSHSGTGDVVLLYGRVGEGKTELARGFIRSYVGMGELIVTSPTYTIMLEYAHQGHRVHHIDLYRLDKPDDLALLPLKQIFKQDVSLVEWPERLVEVPAHAVSVRLEKLAGESHHKRHFRVITISARAEPWRTRIQQWRQTGLPGLEIHKT